MASPVWNVCCLTCGQDTPMPGVPWLPVTASVMVLCPDCGNKRCPKASYHDNACSGSNQTGQQGSWY